MTFDPEHYRVRPSQNIRLSDFDPAASQPDRKAVEDGFKKDVDRLLELQDRFQAEESHSLLVALLAYDTGGKDETITNVFSLIPHQAIRIEKFTTPTEEALMHDFLWRIHIATPRRGEIVVFNRSQYDDVTEPRIEGDIDRKTWERRYQHIRNFEDLLIDEGDTVIRKFYFHISRDEQAKRIRERLDDPEKQWDFDPHDIETHKRWDDYQAAFQDAINATATDSSPWHIIPSDNAWFRDALVARIVVEALEEIDPHYPEPSEDIEQYRKELERLQR